MKNSRDVSIARIDEAKWLKAQEFESDCWKRFNKENSLGSLIIRFLRAAKNGQLFELLKFRDFYCGDDCNFWWKEKFENYEALPQTFDSALEVGCGPYTNIRLISKICKIKEIDCSDPLLELYKSFKWNWVSRMARKNKVKTIVAKCENLPLADEKYDLVVCINVLDHVQDVRKCFSEMDRVLRRGGYFVFAQDLSDENDLQDKKSMEDRGHPIKLHHNFIDSILDQKYDTVLKKILKRDAGRAPKHHYGTYIYIGVKK